MLVLHKKVNYTSTGADLEEGVGEGSGWGEISQTPKKSHFRGPQMFWIPPPPPKLATGDHFWWSVSQILFSIILYLAQILIPIIL